MKPDPFPTPGGTLSPDGVTAAVPHPRMSSFEEARARHCDSVTDLGVEHDRGMTCDGWQAMYDRRGLILTLDATRAELAEARAAAPPDIDVERLAALLPPDHVLTISFPAPGDWPKDAWNVTVRPKAGGAGVVAAKTSGLREAVTWIADRLASPDATRREPSGE